MGKNTVKKPIIDLTRNIDRNVELQLFARSAGRCQFPSCNRFSLEHWITRKVINASQKAHIVAFSPNGPRGGFLFDRREINTFENLMFLCHVCHKLIDDNPDDYPVELLRGYKREHEDRIYALTDIKPESTSQVVTMSLGVRGQPSTVPHEHIVRALGGLHYDPRDLRSISHPELEDGDDAYWKLIKQQIKLDVKAMQLGVIRSETKLPISVFAVGRIPLLIHAGKVLSSLVPVNVHSRNYLTDDWDWIADDKTHDFSFEWVENRPGTEVALLVCLSGNTELENLPQHIRDNVSLARITISNGITDRGCMQRKASGHAFCAVFQQALQEIRLRKPTVFHLVPAVPVAAAVHMGRLMLTADPPALVYDLVGSEYRYTLTVNEHDD